MTKKKKLLVLCLLLMPLVAPAQSSVLGKEITLHMDYIEPSHDSYTKPKAPMRIPCLYADGGMLYFNGTWQGYTLMLYKDGGLVYSGIVQCESFDMLSVLDGLDGDIEIVLESGNVRFYGTLND